MAQIGSTDPYLPPVILMISDARYEVTQLLIAWSDGDRSALGKLMPLVDKELHRLAHHYMRRENVGLVTRPQESGFESWHFD